MECETLVIFPDLFNIDLTGENIFAIPITPSHWSLPIISSNGCLTFGLSCTREKKACQFQPIVRCYPNCRINSGLLQAITYQMTFAQRERLESH